MPRPIPSRRIRRRTSPRRPDPRPLSPGRDAPPMLVQDAAGPAQGGANGSAPVRWDSRRVRLGAGAAPRRGTRSGLRLTSRPPAPDRPLAPRWGASRTEETARDSVSTRLVLRIASMPCVLGLRRTGFGRTEPAPTRRSTGQGARALGGSRRASRRPIGHCVVPCPSPPIQHPGEWAARCTGREVKRSAYAGFSGASAKGAMRETRIDEHRGRAIRARCAASTAACESERWADGQTPRRTGSYPSRRSTRTWTSRVSRPPPR